MPLGRPTEIRVTTDRVPDACRVGIADLRVVAVRRRSARGRSLVFERVRGRIGGEQLPLDARVHGQAQRGEQQFVRHLSIENQREIRNGEKYETEGGGGRGMDRLKGLAVRAIIRREKFADSRAILTRELFIVLRRNHLSRINRAGFLEIPTITHAARTLYIC